MYVILYPLQFLDEDRTGFVFCLYHQEKDGHIMTAMSHKFLLEASRYKVSLGIQLTLNNSLEVLLYPTQIGKFPIFRDC